MPLPLRSRVATLLFGVSIGLVLIALAPRNEAKAPAIPSEPPACLAPYSDARSAEAPDHSNLPTHYATGLYTGN